MRPSHHAIEDDAAQARWEALWAEAPQRSPFSSLGYVRQLAAALGVRAALHFIAEGEVDHAGALVLWRRRGPYRQVVLPPFTPYAAVLTRAVDAEAAVHARQSALEALLEALEARYHLLRFSLPPPFGDVRPATWRGWGAHPFYTYQLRLADAEALHATWSSAARRTFRQAEGAYRFAEGGGAADIARLCVESYARHGRRPPLPQDRLEALVAAAHAEGQARLFTVSTADGTPAGGLAALHDGRTAAYWVAGSVPGPAMTALLGEALPRLHAEGIRTFDFVGANTPSIAEFKRRFGAELASYYRIEKATRPELALLLRR